VHRGRVAPRPREEVSRPCVGPARRRLCAVGVWRPDLEKRRPDRVSVLRGGVCVFREGGGPAHQRRRRNDVPVSQDGCVPLESW
jgi:hypothetical protein